MSSRFSFSPMGLSRMVTVGASASTVTFDIVALGGTTATLATGNAFCPRALRMVNLGTVNAFVQFGPSAPTVSLTTGMVLTPSSNYFAEEIFTLNGQNAAAFISAGTTTINVTPGEGL